MATLWLCDPSELPQDNGRTRTMRGFGPIFDLVALQQLLATKQLDLSDDGQCYVATDICWEKLKALQWTPGNQVSKLIQALKPGRRRQGGDYINSQWCDDSDGNTWPCDSYKVNIDEAGDFSRKENALEYYVKFSIDEDGGLCLILIQCHLSFDVPKR